MSQKICWPIDHFYDQQVISYVEMLTALASVINLSAVSLERSKLIDPHNDEINVANSQLWNAHFICDTRKPRTLWLAEDVFSTGRYIVIVHPMKSRSLCTLTNCRSEKYSWDSKLRALWFLWVVKIFFVLPHFAPKLTFRFTIISCQDPVLSLKIWYLFAWQESSVNRMQIFRGQRILLPKIFSQKMSSWRPHLVNIYIQQIDITRSLHSIGLARSLPFIAMHYSSQQMFEENYCAQVCSWQFSWSQENQIQFAKNCTKSFQQQ